MQSDAMRVLLSKAADNMEMKKTIWKLKGGINDALRIDSIHADIVAEHLETIEGMEDAAARYRDLERRFDDVADLVCVYFDDLADDVDEDEEKAWIDFLIDLKCDVLEELEDKLRFQMYLPDEQDGALEEEVSEGVEAVIQIAMSIIIAAFEREKHEFCDDCIKTAQKKGEVKHTDFQTA